ncbi:P-loop containing nucleoside triphosphate hydrolase protein [Hypoxylon sp. NC1633]|nr:P-loop containing nucleoside triphosphate hydrolase protein [Hypoxylon sp. NC1633]
MTRSRLVKYEHPGSPAESVRSGTMGPPSPTPTRKKLKSAPTDNLDTQSVARSFIRSHAPSAETWQRRDDDPDPILMEMRCRQNSFRGGQPGTPSSQNADASFAQQSFAHPTFADIGLKQKACNDTLGDLQTLGVSHVAALPELVLVGDQSSGKSSLMSGLARVSLPRSAGVCTRCPLHIRLRSSKNLRWSCTVSLQQDYDFQPTPGCKPTVDDVTPNNRFPPWVKMPRETKEFKTIFDRSEIEEVLRWAQIAILNHNQNFELFIPGEGAVAKETPLDVAARNTDAQFSPNIVALQINGPDLPDLSFYDMPGVFISPENEEDEYVVQVVKALTLEYIKREKAIIMWALPMNVDSETAISLGIIREAKAIDRTIGVMTKADQLPPQNIPNWLATFRGEKRLVGHGFFATSRPPESPLEDANKWEELFFDREVSINNQWPVEFADFRDRCGVEVLLQFLSRKLTEAFASSLPTIKNLVHARFKLIEKELAALPELPSNVEHEVKKSLFQFLHQIKSAVTDTEFSSEWNSLNSQFQACVFKMKPTCTVKDSDTQTIDISNLDSEAGTPVPPKRPRPSDSTVRNPRTPTRRTHQDSKTTPVKEEDLPMGGMSRASSIAGAARPKMPSPFAKFFHLGRCTMNIQNIRNDILRKQRPGMPRDLVPDEVRETLCLNAVKKWEKPLETYITKTAELLHRTAKAVLEESLGTLRRRLIFKECQEHLGKFINDGVAAQESRLADLFNSETYQLYMMNDDVFHRYKAQELEQLKRVRGIVRLKALALLPWDYNYTRPEEMTEQEKVAERKDLDTYLPKIGKDPYETEIEVAGFVRGYYMMAAARFVEGVTMNVNSNLLRDFRDGGLDEFMDSKFKIYSSSDPRSYMKLMDEDEKTAKRRLQLKGEMEKLERAMSSINELENSSDDVGLSDPTGTAIHSDIDMEEDAEA